jgi:pimeloyl-ACP methyl ester carboxylesterase
MEFSYAGNKGPVLLFIHGWPDDRTLWSRQVDEFKSTHRVITVTLPHFDLRSPMQGIGHDFPQITALLYETVNRAAKLKPGEQIIV